MMSLKSAVAFALGLSSAALAQDGSFVVTNASDFSVIAFQTDAGGSWGNDWIPGDAILPGEQFRMQFSTAEGACEVATLVTFEDDSQFNVIVDYCSTGHLILENETITAE